MTKTFKTKSLFEVVDSAIKYAVNYKYENPYTEFYWIIGEDSKGELHIKFSDTSDIITN